MKKSELKQIIRECIYEISSMTNPNITRLKSLIMQTLGSLMNKRGYVIKKIRMDSDSPIPSYLYIFTTARVASEDFNISITPYNAGYEIVNEENEETVQLQNDVEVVKYLKRVMLQAFSVK